MKILTLDTQTFLSGIASGAHVEKGGLWHKASGINPFVNPQQDNVDVGLLQTSPIATEITGGVGGTPLSYVTRVIGANSGKVYIGTTAGVNEVNLFGDNNATTTLTNASMSNGLEVFQPRNATTEYLYYWQNAQIGRYGDLNGSPTATDAYITGLENTPYHPSHKFFDEIYYGNGNKIGQLKDDGAGGVSSSLNILDFESNKVVTCLEDDGQFLVIGLTENKGDNDMYGHTVVRFWDKTSSSWTSEWSLPETNIVGLKRVGVTLYAVCPRGVYAFNRSNSPQRIRSISSSQSPTYGKANAVGSIGDAFIWGGTLGSVSSYGKLLPDLVTAYHEPLAGAGTGTTSLLIADAKYMQVLVGTDQPKMYRYNLTAGGATGVSAETVYIPLKGRYDLNRVEMILGEPLTTGDTLDIAVQTDEDVTATTWGTVSFVTNGTTRRVDVYGSKIDVDNLKLKITFNGGNVKIKQINIYGDKQTT